MGAELISCNENQLTLQVTFDLTGNLFEMEHHIQNQINQVGVAATNYAIKRFDTNGENIKIAGIKLTSKGRVSKEYQTPYGATKLERHVYQTSNGGETYCPLDDRAKIIISSTPKLAQILSHKYASVSAKEAALDLELNHGRPTVSSFVKETAEMVGSIAQAVETEWEYALPEDIPLISTVAASLDGTCMLMKDDGYREAMTGNISLYDTDGKRMHTIYVGAAPEYGKAKFLRKLENELIKIKNRFPKANYIGIADGASANWNFLESRTDRQILDFYHATEYLAKASYAFGEGNLRTEWLNNSCHKLKHEMGAAEALKAEMENRLEEINVTLKKPSINIINQIQSAITYFTNQLSRMQYANYLVNKLPIGSGVTEAACKTLIKERLCRSGMRWKHNGASVVITLRALVKTTGRWSQFWNKVNNTSLSCLNLS